jgi:hypothetical protein
MPGLISIRKKFGAKKPLRASASPGSLHMTIQTAVLIETLVELGASVRWASCNIFSTQDHAAAAIAKTGVPVFAWKGETLEEYWELTWKALSHPGGKGPQLVVDDGGDVTLLLHKGYELEEGSDWVHTRPRLPRGAGHQGPPQADPRGVSVRVPRDGEGLARRLRGDDDRRPPPLPAAREGQAARPGDQRQRLGHQVEVRQPLRLPRVARRRPEARDRRHDRRQGRGRVRLRRRRQGLLALAARLRRPGHRDRDRPHQRAPGRDGGLRGEHRRERARRATSTSRRPATATSSPRAHGGDEGPGHRLQHRALRQRDPGGPPLHAPGQAREHQAAVRRSGSRRPHHLPPRRGPPGEPGLRHGPPVVRHVEQLLEPGPRPDRPLEEPGHLQAGCHRLPKHLDEEVGARPAPGAGSRSASS